MRGFSYAFKGLRTAFGSEINLKTHLGFTILALLSGWYFNISMGEWIVVILCIGLVISVELINTSIEYLVNLVSPEFHPVAGKIKDIAAAAVLISAITAFVAGLLIFVPKIVRLLQ